MRILLLLLLSTSVYGAEVTKEGTLQKQDGAWSVEGFDSVEATEDRVIIHDKIYTDWRKDSTGMGARFEGMDVLADNELTYTFLSNNDGISVFFLKNMKPVSPKDAPDLDAKVTLFAQNVEAASVSKGSTPAPIAGGGCASTGSTPVMLLAVMAALLMRRKVYEWEI